MEFADFDVLGRNVCFRESGACGVLCHPKAHEVDGRAVKEGWVVRCKMLAGYLYGLRPQVRTSGEEGF